MIIDKSFNCQKCQSSNTLIVIEIHRIISVNCSCNNDVKAFKVDLIDSNGIEIRQDSLRYISKVQEYYQLLDDQGCDTCLDPYLLDNELLNSIQPVEKTSRYFLYCNDCDEENEEIIHNADFVQAIKQNLLFVMGNPLYIEVINQVFSDIRMIDLLGTYTSTRLALAEMRHIDESLLTPTQLEEHRQLYNAMSEKFDQLFGDSIDLEN